MSGGMSVIDDLRFFFEFCEDSIQTNIQSEAFRDLLKHLKEKKPRFDVMVIDYFMQEPFIAVSTEGEGWRIDVRYPPTGIKTKSIRRVEKKTTTH